MNCTVFLSPVCCRESSGGRRGAVERSLGDGALWCARLSGIQPHCTAWAPQARPHSHRVISTPPACMSPSLQAQQAKTDSTLLPLWKQVRGMHSGEVLSAACTVLGCVPLANAGWTAFTGRMHCETCGAVCCWLQPATRCIRMCSVWMYSAGNPGRGCGLCCQDTLGQES